MWVSRIRRGGSGTAIAAPSARRSLRVTFLEYVFQGKLHLPHIGAGPGDDAELCGRVRVLIRRGPHRMIGGVEQFPPELQALRFDNPEILVQGKVPRQQARADDRVPPQVSE